MQSSQRELVRKSPASYSAPLVFQLANNNRRRRQLHKHGLAARHSGAGSTTSIPPGATKNAAPLYWSNYIFFYYSLHPRGEVVQSSAKKQKFIRIFAIVSNISPRIIRSVLSSITYALEFSRYTHFYTPTYRRIFRISPSNIDIQYTVCTTLQIKKKINFVPYSVMWNKHACDSWHPSLLASLYTYQMKASSLSLLLLLSTYVLPDTCTCIDC